MPSDLGGRTRQVLLLFVLALSVIGMHHTPLPPHCTSVEVHAPADTGTMTMVQQSDHCDTGMGHDLLHLCLAVLGAAGGLLLLAWLLLAIGFEPLVAGFLLWLRWVRRPPGLAGRSLLTSLCVLRT